MSMPGFGPQPPMQPPVAVRGSRAPVLISWISAVLAVVCVGAAVTMFVLYSGEHHDAEDRRTTETQLRQQVSDANKVSDRRTAAQRAACDFAVSMATYDYTDMEKYRSAMLDASTGAWKQNFNQTWPSLRQVMTQAQTRSKAGETHCGLSTLGAHNAEVLVFVNQTITNVVNAEARSSSLTTITTLDEQADGRWLVSEMKMPIA